MLRIQRFLSNRTHEFRKAPVKRLTFAARQLRLRYNLFPLKISMLSYVLYKLMIYCFLFVSGNFHCFHRVKSVCAFGELNCFHINDIHLGYVLNFIHFKKLHSIPNSTFKASQYYIQKTDIFAIPHH